MHREPPRTSTMRRPKDLHPGKQPFEFLLSLHRQHQVEELAALRTSTRSSSGGRHQSTGGDPTSTVEDLADDFDCGVATISRILKAAGKKWKSGWITHEVIQAQLLKRKTSLKNAESSCLHSVSGQGYHRRRERVCFRDPMSSKSMAVTMQMRNYSFTSKRICTKG
ncbi:hypothetical protein KIN20_035648 [Parelaphostrongylus tenuis]|uniref:Uncharacterized protein n=1 Tax=Parelaphostrongylus tenuis TaxID=148309 RepID=A0AAD5RBG8_PARTN|nr:hypothetical protein KIN20_035648 [Parelaphostrongylus tenuis]